MNENYSTVLRQMLQRSRQQESLGGRALSPGERAAMIQGVLMPYTESYRTGMMAAREREEEAARYDEEQDLREQQLKQQEEAAEVAGYTQLAQIGVGGATQYAMTSGGGGGGAATSGHAAGSGSSTSSGGGGGWGGPALAFVGGGAVGYGVSPYGQKLEEGTGGQTRAIFKADPFGGSRRRGQRVGMMAAGGIGGGAATGGNPYGAAGGVIGGYFQENPETGKRGYQEQWEYEIKPLYKSTVRPVARFATGAAGRLFRSEPTGVGKKVTKTVKKIKKKIKFW
jgi:hypothetical protein